LREQIVREEKIECDFSRCGHLEVACKQAHFDGYARQAEVVAREFNHELTIVPRDELRSEIGSDIYYGGMVDERAWRESGALRVWARRGSHAGGGVCARAGSGREDRARIAAGCTGLEGDYVARRVVDAGRVRRHQRLYRESDPGLQKRIIPIGSYIITTEVLPEALARELSPRNRMIYDSKNYIHYYRLTPDHRMLFGGRAAFFLRAWTRSARARKSCGGA